MAKVDGKKVYMDAHFVSEHSMFNYATARQKAEIDFRHNVVWVSTLTEADFFLNVFFTSIGTDQDTFGLSLPLPVSCGDSADLAELDLLSLKIFHGISE